MKIERATVELGELEAIIERAASAPLGGEERAKLSDVVQTLALVYAEVGREGASLRRLRQLLLGCEPAPSRESGNQTEPAPAGSDTKAAPEQNGERPKRKGHGRNGSEQYPGAERVVVAHPSLHHGALCPGCEKGKVYLQNRPRRIVRITAMTPFRATVWELERLRCGLCGEMYSAPAPAGIGEEKYDTSVAAMLAQLHYGTGMPFYRLEKVQGGLGVPLPVGTQWEEISKHKRGPERAHAELVRQAAGGRLLHQDDTSMRVLELGKEIAAEIAAGTGERTGVFTSGIVSVLEGERQIVLYYTGRKHAGENLLDLLKQRDAEQALPIQMCDASSRNTPEALKVILAHCNAHARRRFGDQRANFPQPCAHILEAFHKIYENDAHARKEHMTAQERLAYHRANSALVLSALKKWFYTQFHEKRIEPNSELGEAVRYMLKHWRGLTLFLRVAGAPLDNNLCERILKRAILHRKNSLFYKTRNGAAVGDLFMSLIQTAELNHVNPFNYLLALMRYPQEVECDPAQWMPWNYETVLAHLEPSRPPPS